VTLFRFAAHFGARKPLLDQLVGAAIRGMALGTTRKVLAHHSFSVHTLETLHAKFQAFADANDYGMDFDPERLYCLNEIQRMFTDDRHGGGHVPKSVVDLSPGVTQEQRSAFLKLERRETTQRTEAFFEHLRIAAGKCPWELQHEPNGVMQVLHDHVRQNAFLDAIGPVYFRAMEIAWRARTELDAVVTLLAALRYEADRGEFAESLEELVAAGYLERIPRDNYSSGPLIYRRTQDGFLLYSCGLDFDDDGGTPSKWGRGEQGGDQVFWPVRDRR
jgi:hypothetical protein